MSLLAPRLQSDVTPQQLRRYAQIVYQKIGVTISEQKATLLSNRLRRRLRATGLNCYDDYYELLCRTATADPEWEAFLQEVTTHETFLFRDKSHWDWIHGTFLPDLLAQVRAGTRGPTLPAPSGTPSPRASRRWRSTGPGSRQPLVLSAVKPKKRP